MEIQHIPVSQITADASWNIRKDTDESGIAELAAAIEKDGLLQPICVQQKGTAAKPKYALVFGFRRFAAIQSLGTMETVPCIVEPKTISEGALVLRNLAENTARQNLNPIDEAEGAQRLLALNVPEEEILASLGWTKTYLSRTIKLTGLREGLKDALRARKITPTQAVEIDKTPEEYHERLIELASETSLNALRAEVAAILARENATLQPVDEDGEHDESSSSIEAVENELVAVDVLVNTVSEAWAELMSLAYRDPTEQAVNLRRLNEIKWERLDYTHLAMFAAISQDVASMVARRLAN